MAKTFKQGDMVKWTENMLAVLIKQTGGNGTGAWANQLRTIQGSGMTVQRVFPSGRVNVVFIDPADGQPAYRTFPPRDIELF